jgi:inorganic phosphate transporter, PiT family
MLFTLMVIAIVLTYIFTFINGMHDGCNVVATIISSRSMKPRNALIIACAAELIGPLFIGTAVADTVGKGVIKYQYLNNPGNIIPVVTILSALIGAICWNLFTWKIGLPSSSSHALLGGLFGAGIAAYGLSSIEYYSFFWKVIVSMLASPVIGFIVGYIFMKISILILKDSSPKVNKLIKKTQILSMIFLGTSHGSSDGQKSAGVLALLLVIGQMQTEFVVPKWTIFTSDIFIVAGILLGGWNIIKTVGSKIYKVKPLHSLDTQLSSASVIFAASLLGAPVSTTHIVSSSIMGIGSAERINAVNWIKVKSIVLSWLTTIPMSALAGMLVFYIINIFI